MALDKLLSSVNFWPAYKTANPTTTPDDVALVRAMVDRMPQHPSGLIRMLEGRPDINGMLKSERSDPLKAIDKDIWLSREGPAYKSKNPIWGAGTILHEDSHLRGADEVAARETQLGFLKDAIGRKETKIPKKEMSNLEEWLAAYKRLAAQGQKK